MKIVASPWSAWALRFARRQAAACGLLMALMGASCGGLPKTYYYTLRVPPPPPANDPKTNLVLGVERFRAPEVLRDDRIVFYESPTQLNFYQYHRWSSDPATMLTELVARRLDQMGVFAEVRRLPAREPVDYVLRGRLFNFEEVDYEAGVKARAALELTLVRARDGKVVWSVTRQAEGAVQEKGVPGVVKALDAASEQLLREALPALVAQAGREAKETSGQPQ